MTEEWRAVLGFEGSYEVSSFGCVRSLPGKWRGKGKLLSLCTIKYGYQVVQLSGGGRGVTRWIHRLVLDAFVGPRPRGMEGSHLDGNASNNALSNLRWESKAENERRKVEHGHIQHGERSPIAKLTNDDVIEMRRRRAAGEYYHDIARDFGVARSTARRAVVGIGGWAELLEKS